MNYNYLLTYCDDLAANSTALAVGNFLSTHRRSNKDSSSKLPKYERSAQKPIT
jgi:hypothetical protein